MCSNGDDSNRSYFYGPLILISLRFEAEESLFSNLQKFFFPTAALGGTDLPMRIVCITGCMGRATVRAAPEMRWRRRGRWMFTYQRIGVQQAVQSFLGWTSNMCYYCDGLSFISYLIINNMIVPTGGAYGTHGLNGGVLCYAFFFDVCKYAISRSVFVDPNPTPQAYFPVNAFTSVATVLMVCGIALSQYPS